jgi:hypothetical protein
MILFSLQHIYPHFTNYIQYEFALSLQLKGLEGATPRQPFNFTVDASGTGGLGDVCLDIVSGGRSVPHRMEPLGGSMYRVSLIPQQAGKHRVYVYFNGGDVKGKQKLFLILRKIHLIIGHKMLQLQTNSLCVY